MSENSEKRQKHTNHFHAFRWWSVAFFFKHTHTHNTKIWNAHCILHEYTNIPGTITLCDRVFISNHIFNTYFEIKQKQNVKKNMHKHILRIKKRETYVWQWHNGRKKKEWSLSFFRSNKSFQNRNSLPFLSFRAATQQRRINKKMAQMTENG